MKKRYELSDPNSCTSRAGIDEMMFVLLERDAAAPMAIRTWAAERIRLGRNTAKDPQIIEALACATAMEESRVPKRTETNVGQLGHTAGCAINAPWPNTGPCTCEERKANERQS